VSYAPGSELALAKNPAYTWGPPALSAKPPLLDKLIFRIVTHDSGRYNALQSGQLADCHEPAAERHRGAQKSGRFKQLTVESIGTPLGMPINVTKPPTDDPRVRQAIMYAVNQECWSSRFLFGVDTPAHTCSRRLPPVTASRPAGLYSYDPAKPMPCSTRQDGRWAPAGPHQERPEARLDIILFANSGWRRRPSSWSPS